VFLVVEGCGHRHLCLALLWLLAFFATYLRLAHDHRIDTGTMTTGPMMTGLTNGLAGGDSEPTAHLCATDAVEPALSSVAARETGDSETGVYSNGNLSIDPNPDSWRVEVAARLERYRTRRKPRTPRYPSLLLPFDAPESWSRSAAAMGSGAPSVAAAPALAEEDFTPHAFELKPGAASLRDAGRTNASAPAQGAPESTLELTAELSAKVIEFPRSAAIPVFHTSNLADPVFDRYRPRIVEAPEILPPPPALGGILIEPTQAESGDRRSDTVSVARSASIARRALASLVDGAILGTSLAVFAAIFLRLNPVRLNSSLHLSLNLIRGPLPVIAGALGVVALLLWAAYQYLFVVYTGSTPGLRVAGLRLAGFDGSPVHRRLRRWRVLASFLSAFSAGLGYVWCLLDQNGLCWHDRISRTCVQSTDAEGK
jgi:uncharacterized RDD family membrane protein YckC